MVRVVKKIMILLISFVMLFGCSSEKGREINENDASLTQSMKNFHAEACQDYVKGDSFQVKLCSMVKIVNEKQNCYRYQLLVAPLKDGKKSIRSIVVKLQHDLGYFNNGSAYIAFTGIAQGGFPLNLPMWEKISQFEAYRLDFTFDNVSNDYQKMAFSGNFDGMMKELQVIIEWNLVDRELINIDFTAEIPVITDINDPLLESRSDLRMIFEHQNAYEPLAAVYDGNDYPVSQMKGYEYNSLEKFTAEYIRNNGYSADGIYEINEHVSGLDNDALHALKLKDKPDKNVPYSDYWYYYPVYENGQMIFAVIRQDGAFSVSNDTLLMEALTRILEEKKPIYIAAIDDDVYVFRNPLISNGQLTYDYYMLNGEGDNEAIDSHYEVLNDLVRQGEEIRIDLVRRTRIEVW